MNEIVRLELPVEADIAKALENPARRQAAGRYLGSLLTGDQILRALAEAIAAAKQEARANGLTDEDIDAELEAWRAERRG
jgi:hypothetical protein